MEQLYFQLLIIILGIYATLTTGFIGWMALTVWRMSNKVSVFEVQFSIVTGDITRICEDIGHMRKYDALIATHATQIAGLDRRLTDIEHKPYQFRRRDNANS